MIKRDNETQVKVTVSDHFNRKNSSFSCSITDVIKQKLINDFPEKEYNLFHNGQLIKSDNFVFDCLQINRKLKTKRIEITAVRKNYIKMEDYFMKSIANVRNVIFWCNLGP